MSLELAVCFSTGKHLALGIYDTVEEKGPGSDSGNLHAFFFLLSYNLIPVLELRELSD